MADLQTTATMGHTGTTAVLDPNKRSKNDELVSLLWPCSSRRTSRRVFASQARQCFGVSWGRQRAVLRQTNQRTGSEPPQSKVLSSKHGMFEHHNVRGLCPPFHGKSWTTPSAQRLQLLKQLGSSPIRLTLVDLLCVQRCLALATISRGLAGYPQHGSGLAKYSSWLM